MIVGLLPLPLVGLLPLHLLPLPLRATGLRMIVKSETDKSRETDFLSSVEMLVIDQLDYLLMQV